MIGLKKMNKDLYVKLNMQSVIKAIWRQYYVIY